MKNSHRFFSNKECKYFPCHQNCDEEFNCLFCYCPLYFLAENCGGRFQYGENGVKDCTGCCLPHLPAYYDVIVKKLKESCGK